MSCTSTSPASVIFYFSGSLFVVKVKAGRHCLLCVVKVLLQVTVYYQDVKKVFDCVARVQSSAYPNFSDSVGGRSLMFTLKNDGASTDHWGRPFFNIRFRLTWLPRNTLKFRWLIRLAINLIVVRHLMAFDNFIMSPACQTVS